MDLRTCGWFGACCSHRHTCYCSASECGRDVVAASEISWRRGFQYGSLRLKLPGQGPPWLGEFPSQYCDLAQWPQQLLYTNWSRATRPARRLPLLHPGRRWDMDFPAQCLYGGPGLGPRRSVALLRQRHALRGASTAVNCQNLTFNLSGFVFSRILGTGCSNSGSYYCGLSSERAERVMPSTSRALSSWPGVSVPFSR